MAKKETKTIKISIEAYTRLKHWKNIDESNPQAIHRLLEEYKSYEIVGKDFRLIIDTSGIENSWFWLKTRKIYSGQLIDIEGYDEYSMHFKIVDE